MPVKNSGKCIDKLVEFCNYRCYQTEMWKNFVMLLFYANKNAAIKTAFLLRGCMK